MMQYQIFLIIILGVSFATTTSSTDAIQADTCDSCCQGPQGVPGQNGLTGRDGLRGDPGVRGLQGDPGLDGLDGLDGSDGLDGPAGPSGIDGEKGEQGLIGENGQKGEVGQKGESGESVAKSAFTAIKTSPQTGNLYDVLTFDVTETNYGDHFSTGTSKFTCKIPGVYWFTFTMCRYDSGEPVVYLVKEGTNIVCGQYYDPHDGLSILTQSTNGAVLQLKAGEQVWVEFGRSGERVYSDAARYTSFSGFLLFET